MVNQLLNLQSHKKILLLTLPMVFSTITVPLLGLVDTAVIGHLDQAWYLGGVAVGSMIINIILWLFGFLRMATTGMTAQAYGAKDIIKQANLLFQGLFMAFILGLGLLILANPLVNLILSFNSASQEIKFYAEQYFLTRILSTPAALANLVIIGWLLGRQHSTQTMLVIITTNIINIILSLLFVINLGWQVKGVALASVVADYSGLLLALYFVSRDWPHPTWPKFKEFISGIEKLFQLNFDIFLRSVCLQLTFSFLVFYGATLGDNIAAANAVLMSFLMLISYGVDGFAYTMEAMVGEAIGQNNKKQLINSIIIITFWCFIISIILTLAFIFKGGEIISFISDIAIVQETALVYLPWLTAFPLIAMWCFLLDGIFVGAAKGREMRNSMMIACACFFITWWLSQNNGNHALWLAMLVFMAVRALILSLKLDFLHNKN